MLSARSYTLLFVAFIFLPPDSEGGNILALFTSTQRSHHLVYEGILEVLLERDHHVTVVSTAALPTTILSSSNKLQHIQIQQVYNTTLTNGRINGLQKLQSMLQSIDNAGLLLQQNDFKRFLSEPRSRQFDLLILGYHFNDYMLGVAAHFQCPVALVWPTQPIGFIHTLMGNPEERWYVTQPYDRYQYTGFSALAFGVFEKFVEVLAVERMRIIYDTNFPVGHYPSFEEMRKNISLVLCNHHSASEGPIAPYLPNIIEVGGIQGSTHQEVLPESLQLLFADPHQQIVYLSLGSRVKWSGFPAKTVKMFVNTFRRVSEQSNITIIWKYDGPCSEISAPWIICAPWWPQNALLAQPQTRLFITHGGKGSLTEALHHGVPMLGLPIFGDQRANIAKMQRQGFGLELNIFTLNETQLFDAIEVMMQHNLTFAANVKRFSYRYRDRPLLARDAAVFWLEYVMRHKGAAHMQSALLHLSALEYYLIDVYAVIACGLAAFVLICNWLEQRLT